MYQARGRSPAAVGIVGLRVDADALRFAHRAGADAIVDAIVRVMHRRVRRRIHGVVDALIFSVSMAPAGEWVEGLCGIRKGRGSSIDEGVASIHRQAVGVVRGGRRERRDDGASSRLILSRSL